MGKNSEYFRYKNTERFHDLLHRANCLLRESDANTKVEANDIASKTKNGLLDKALMLKSVLFELGRLYFDDKMVIVNDDLA